MNIFIFHLNIPEFVSGAKALTSGVSAKSFPIALFLASNSSKQRQKVHGLPPKSDNKYKTRKRNFKFQSLWHQNNRKTNKPPQDITFFDTSGTVLYSTLTYGVFFGDSFMNIQTFNNWVKNDFFCSILRTS